MRYYNLSLRSAPKILIFIIIKAIHLYSIRHTHYKRFGVPCKKMILEREQRVKTPYISGNKMVKRSERLTLLFRLVQRCVSCNEKKLINEFSYKEGISARTIKEYIAVLIQAKQIKRIDEDLWVNGQQSQQ